MRELITQNIIHFIVLQQYVRTVKMVFQVMSINVEERKNVQVGD